MCLAMGGGGKIHFFFISLMIFATLSQPLPPKIPCLVSSASPASFQIKVNFSFFSYSAISERSQPLSIFFLCFIASRKTIMKG